jgi:hypothetical protein
VRGQAFHILREIDRSFHPAGYCRRRTFDGTPPFRTLAKNRLGKLDVLLLEFGNLGSFGR